MFNGSRNAILIDATEVIFPDIILIGDSNLVHMGQCAPRPVLKHTTNQQFNIFRFSFIFYSPVNAPESVQVVFESFCAPSSYVAAATTVSSCCCFFFFYDFFFMLHDGHNCCCFCIYYYNSIISTSCLAQEMTFSKMQHCKGMMLNWFVYYVSFVVVIFFIRCNIANVVVSFL